MASILGRFGDKIIEELKEIMEKGKKKQLYADSIIRNSNGEILLLQRSYQDDFMPGKWSLPGGKIESGEKPEVAAPRELQEETVIELSNLQFVKKIEKDDCTINYFSGQVADDILIVLDNEEHYRYEFVAVDRLDRYEMLLDLGEVLKNELLPLLPVIELKENNQLTPEEAFSLIKSAFDNDQIDLETFVNYHDKYNDILKAKMIKEKEEDVDEISKELVPHSKAVLAAFAKETSATELKRIINESHDEKLRKAAHDELDRRERLEKKKKLKSK